jgi:hypothetical protein
MPLPQLRLILSQWTESFVAKKYAEPSLLKGVILLDAFPWLSPRGVSSGWE